MSRLRLVLIAVAVVLLGRYGTARAHRLDEYLESAKIDLSRERITVKLRLTPGIAVADSVWAAIDADGDGTASDAEQTAYSERAGRDLVLLFDGTRQALRCVAVRYPTRSDVRAGLGEIDLTFAADVRSEPGVHNLAFDNRHQPTGAAPVYLANCLIPADPDLSVTGQDRSPDQSSFGVTYALAGPAASSNKASWQDRNGVLSLALSYLHLGILHILTGYDHLLFVSALVLAARGWWDLVKVVSAFTVAHTLTLTLAATGVVHVSPRLVEPLISASIVFVALQNVLRPTQAGGTGRLAAAFFFGLFHGLGFGGLLDAMRDLPGGPMVLAILAFSVGVEAGHQAVVLPLFAALRVVRCARSDAVRRTQWSMRVQRYGSALISVAGAYYLCIALLPG